jgi:hypothetical protein
VKPSSPEVTPLKAALDSILLAIRGVEEGEVSGLAAYFVSKKMFACINGNGVGIRLPAAAARDLVFSRSDVTPFQPKGRPSTPEWVQLDHADPADFRQDQALFLASIEFVKNARSR